MTNQHDKEMLLPCPFCGGIDLHESSRTSGHGESIPYIYCLDCDGSMEDYIGNHIAKWNTRATTRATTRYKAALREAVSALEAFQRGDAKIQVIVAEALTTINDILGEK